MKKMNILKSLLIASFLFTTSSYAEYDTNKLNSNFLSWGINGQNERVTINLPNAWKNFNMNKEVIVAVVDTGIDPSHPFLKNNIYVPGGVASERNYGLDFSAGRESKFRPYDQHGHGTHVSGIIKAIFPDVKILPIKYYNPEATGAQNLKSNIDALRFAVEQNVDVINYSGGGPAPSTEELKVLKEAERKGILVVAAAGNEESNIDRYDKYFPASYGLSNVIAVTAYDQDLRVISPFNWGPQTVDVAAPGYRIKSTLPNGRAGYLTGTSQATAFVTGVAALIKAQNPELNAVQIKDLIRKSAKQEITLMGKCNAGKLDAAKAIEMAQKERHIASEPAPSKVILRIAK